MKNTIIFGLVAGICISAAGSSIVEQPVKTFVLIVILIVVANMTYGGRKL